MKHRRRGRPQGKIDRRIDLRPGEGPATVEGEFTPTAPQKWSPRHNLICLLASAGMKQVEIASELRLSAQQVSNIVNDPRATQVILEAQKRIAGDVMDLNHRLRAHAHEALDEIVDELRTSKNEHIRQKAGFGLLDRAGYTPVQQHVVRSAPELPPGLAEVITETHTELRQIHRAFRYQAPQQEEPEGVDLSELNTGTNG